MIIQMARCTWASSITLKVADPASAQANAEAAFQSWGKVAKNPNATACTEAGSVETDGKPTYP
jgi:hypothetical protein